MNIIKASPTLESETRTGKKKYWQAQVVEESGTFFTRTRYWQDTADGESKEQYSEPKVSHPTNVGRSNERNNEDQSYFEFDAMVVKQTDKGYHEAGKVSETSPLPMLANKWTEKKHTMKFPVALQPKLDGVRMLMLDEFCWSRMGKDMIPEVVQHLAIDTIGLILDGELILEGYTFQDTMRAVKKFREELSPLLTYHVFDVVMPKIPFVTRYEVLEDFFRDNTLPKNLKLVPTLFNVKDEDELMEHHRNYVCEGYEGTIIRSPGGLYQIGQRSSDLLKYKDFEDSEFGIIDVVEGEGRDSGAAIFVCKTDTGFWFAVRPKGTMESRQEAFRNKADYIGKNLTVKYQGVSEEGVPRFPIGIGIREGVQG